MPERRYTGCTSRPNLLAPGVFVGERKGNFSYLVAEKHEFTSKDLDGLAQRVDAVSEAGNDPWPAQVHAWNSDDHSIINDMHDDVQLYIRGVHQLWRLGHKAIPEAESAAGS